MMEKVTRRIAEKLGDTLAANPEQIEIYAYGLELLILPVINLIIVSVLAYIIGILPNVFAFLLVFAPFRLWGGGVHLTTSIRCLVVSTVIIVGLSSLSMINISAVLLYILLFSSFLLGLYVTEKWVPACSQEKAITDYEKAIRQKKYMIILIICWFIASLLMTKMHLYNYVLALILGAISSLLLMTPGGFYLIGAIDKKLDDINKGGVKNV